MNNTLFFMHITKTAGGSVKEMLKQSKADVIFHYAEEPTFKRWFWYRPAPEIIYGHFPWGVHERAQLPARYAAFFREPISRCISHYHHLRDVDFVNPAGDFARKFRDFSDFIRNSKRWDFDNFMCRLVSGISEAPRYGKVTQSVLDTALENLNRDFDFIGIFERLPESVARLNKIVPSLNAKIPSVNVGAYQRDIPDEFREAADEANRYDAILYQEAVKLAEQR
jgi:hypothetical protein